MPRFTFTLRGYSPGMVDDYLRRLAEALDQLAAGQRIDPPAPPGFDRALRGYDRAQVDQLIAEELETAHRLRRDLG
jgi:DivIVA domain-containing protein